MNPRKTFPMRIYWDTYMCLMECVGLVMGDQQRQEKLMLLIWPKKHNWTLEIMVIPIIVNG